MAPCAGRQIVTVRAVLRGVSPLVWRRVEVRASSHLVDLYWMLRVVFDEWDGEYAHRFLIRGRQYCASGYQHSFGSMHETQLHELGLGPQEHLVFCRGHLDRWVYDIEVESVQPAISGRFYPRCVGGARATPPAVVQDAAEYMALRLDWFRIAAGVGARDEERFGRLSREIATGYDPELFSRVHTNRALRAQFRNGRFVPRKEAFHARGSPSGVCR